MAHTDAQHPYTGRNRDFAMAMMETSRSNATTPKAPRKERRKATRRDQVRAAVREYR